MKNKNIHERIYSFVIRVLNLLKYLPKTSQNLIIISQITRSATSMGSNDQEADGTQTRKDFMHCYTMVRKEGKETNYWLRLISDTNITLKPRMVNLMQECDEIVRIVSKIIYNTRSKKS